MTCEYCHGEGYHNTMCPFYEQPKASHYCSICGEGIYNGEQYVRNYDNEYAHYECFYTTKDLIEWLGGEIRTKDDDYD